MSLIKIQGDIIYMPRYSKEDELFDYVDYPRYYGISKYNELDDDHEYNKNKDNDFEISL